MAVTPKFLTFVNTYTELLYLTTNRSSQFLIGKIDLSTIDLQISVRNGPFSSDNDLIYFEGETFYIPNPAVYPDGLDLTLGVNYVRVRAIDTSGSISAPAVATLKYLQLSEVPTYASPPTRIVLEKLDGSVKISVRGEESSNVLGYNFYCSTTPGGGPQGYSRLNLSTVTSFTTVSQETSLGSFVSDVTLKLEDSGNELAADPLFYQFTGNQQDTDGNVLQADFNELLEIPENVRKIRSNIQVSQVETVRDFSFIHNRNASAKSEYPAIPNGDFAATLETDPLYYVVTTVFLDDSTGYVIESSNSEEVSGYPLKVNASVGSFPLVTTQQINEDLSLKIYRRRPDLDIQPGSFQRDTFIDPATSALTRTNFLIDFAHRAGSFATLLEFDDPRREGISVSVSQSQYKLGLKQALFLTEDPSVQEVIDQAFEKLASNYGVFRKAGEKSRGEVTFYTTRIPTSSITIPIGTIVSGAGVRYRTTSNAQITLANIASFYNPFTGRYSVKAFIQSESPGSGTNLSSNQIKTILNGPSGLSVVNENAVSGGKDLQSNLELALEAQNKISSVDSGTYQGIRKNTVATPGVVQSMIVGPGDDLMYRDIDPDTGRHLGGKVDVWVRGSRSGNVSDIFAFSFKISRDILFEVYGDPANLEFISTDPLLSEDNPIVELLNYPDLGFSFRNDTRGVNFDLTSVTVSDYNKIKLSPTVVQPEYSVTDLIRGDYRYRTSNRYVFPRQPVNYLVSLKGTVTGTVTPSVYTLKRSDSPLRTGRSTIASDYLELLDPLSQGVVIPSSNLISVTNEVVVIVGEYPEYLRNLGINPVSLKVYNASRTILYNGPYVANSDYLIVELDGKVGIQRVASGQIVSSQTLSVDYMHDENFSITYNIDFLVGSVQNSLNDSRHLSADIIVKQTVKTFVDISGSVIVKKGVSPSTVDSQIRATLINHIENLGLNRALRLSDVIRIIDQTTGVSYVIIPSMIMARASGSLIIGEFIENDGIKMDSLSSTINNVYLLQDALDNYTTDGGGPLNQYRYVLLNDSETELLPTRPDLLNQAPKRSYIIGFQGLAINGYSDDQTLISQGFLTPSEIGEERKRLTANHVLVSLGNNDSLDNYTIQTSYVTTTKNVGADDLLATIVESFSLRSMVITYDEDRV